ncbi:hypothetical protein SAMN04487950_2687 [Halogranum rubrum]|uniref:Probable membrane transporter protein n=1 Tax=Halogranum rubrum TaxID=553466 RepID=A0A1I4F7Y5_9EURY|nr:sulfite exporter TauE/SafE family protein [Halogranum rubrum]SFL14014.1 hypothetical protein SAMN04487950_2687 [Halogranum rubrum]
MILGFDVGLAAVLVFVAFFAGIGITAVGPGGIFLTVALFALTPVAPATVVGTASATFVATGLLGTATYVRSGELSDATGWRLAAVLSATGIVGALLGVRLNDILPTDLFGILLGVFVSATGLLIWWRTRTSTDVTLDPTTRRGTLVTAGLGLFVGVAGGLLGVGGPVLAVPLLVASGVPLLAAVGAAQVQSVFIAAFATAGYLVRDAVSVELAVLVGVPELAGVVVGWWVAHHVDETRLKQVLAAVLVVVGPYIAFS